MILHLHLLFYFSLPLLQPIAEGIESVKRVVQQKGIEGVYGPLIENFTCNEKFFTAIDVTGGNK